MLRFALLWTFEATILVRLVLVLGVVGVAAAVDGDNDDEVDDDEHEDTGIPCRLVVYFAAVEVVLAPDVLLDVAFVSTKV